MSVVDAEALRQARIVQIALVVIAVLPALLYVVLPVGATSVGNDFGVSHLIPLTQLRAA